METQEKEIINYKDASETEHNLIRALNTSLDMAIIGLLYQDWTDEDGADALIFELTTVLSRVSLSISLANTLKTAKGDQSKLPPNLRDIFYQISDPYKTKDETI